MARIDDIKYSLRMYPMSEEDLESVAEIYSRCVDNGQLLTRADFYRLFCAGERSEELRSRPYRIQALKNVEQRVRAELASNG